MTGLLRWRVGLLMGVLAAVGMLAAVACGAAEAPTPTSRAVVATPTPASTATPVRASTYKDKIVVALQTVGIDNFYIEDSSQGGVDLLGHVFDAPFDLDFKTGEVVPGLIESWKLADDFVTWTFNLREGVQMHDGGVLDAEDFKFSMDLYLTQGALSGASAVLRTGLDSVVVTGPRQVVVKLKAPSVGFLPTLTLYPPAFVLSADYYKAVGKEQAGRNPVGSGAFKFVSWAVGDKATYEAFPKHWRGSPVFKKLEMQIVPEPATRGALLISGAADMVHVTDEVAVDLRKRSNVVIWENAGGSNVFLWFRGLFLPTRDSYKPDLPWHNVTLRKAMALAIDKKEIQQTLFGGRGRIPSTPIVNYGTIGWDPTLEPYPYDPVQARQLLAQTPYVGLEVEMWETDAYFRLPQGFSEAIGAYWTRNLGFKVTNVPTDYRATQRPAIFNRTTGDVPQIANQTTDWSVIQFMRLGYTSSTGLFGMYESAEMDEIVRRAQSARTLEEFEPIVREWSRYVYREYTMIPILDAGEMFARSANILYEQPIGINNLAHLETLRFK